MLIATNDIHGCVLSLGKLAANGLPSLDRKGIWNMQLYRWYY